MATKLKWEWEALDDETSRVKVVGGWLVCHKTSTKSESMVFIADHNHQWHILVPQVEEAKKPSVAKDF